MFKWLRKKNDTAAEAREYVKVGFEARQSGDWASARVAFEAALRIDPSNADAHYLLGLLALGWWGWRMGGLPLLQLGMPLC